MQNTTEIRELYKGIGKFIKSNGGKVSNTTESRLLKTLDQLRKKDPRLELVAITSLIKGMS